jgi:hypothetical protein
LKEPLTAQLPALDLPSEAIDVAMSNLVACVVLSSGEVHCWGENGQGQLGAGSRLSSSQSPLRVAGIAHACAVAASDEHACAVERRGSVACWGGNSAGQCGQDREYTYDVRHLVVAQTVPRISDARQVAVGSFGSCALDRAGVACWGDVLRGRSTPSPDAGVWDPTQPAFFPPFADVTAVSAAGSCACAVRQDGTMGCFALNANGCAGLNSDVPWDRVTETIGVRRLAIGSGGACVEMTAGGLQCWRGPRASPDRGEPVTVPAEGVEELAMGAAPCFRAGNWLRCWPVRDWQSAEPLAGPRTLRIE